MLRGSYGCWPSRAAFDARDGSIEREHVMERRTFMALVSGGLLAAPLAVAAQQPARVARIGYLVSGSLESPEARASLDAFRQGLREQGYVEGQNLLIEYREADGKLERLAGLALELARLKPDLIVAGATPGARAAKQATTTIPIVAPSMGDPVRDGLVASLARPGANLTGSTFLGPELVPKRLELLKEALPKVSRVAVLWHPRAFGERTMKDMWTEIEAAARTLAVQLQPAQVEGPDQLDHTFTAMVRGRPEALFTFPSTMLFSQRRR